MSSQQERQRKLRDQRLREKEDAAARAEAEAWKKAERELTWESAHKLKFERNRRETHRFFERRRATIDVYAVPSAFSRVFGAEDTLLGRAEVKLAQLMTAGSFETDVPLVSRWASPSMSSPR